MTRVYYVFDKLSIIAIIIGFVLGGYLAINYTSSNLWFDAIPLIIIIAFLLTIPIILDFFISKDKHKNKFPYRAVLESFLLNIAILAVCTAFGIALGSFYVNNYMIK
ncbi:hypothetical protein [Methanobrevibacter sp.]|uniref:hypothetical protein n=1 Tax=Methanobrevibacter sp. TaxID=66852 RepID=UPI00389065D8